MKSNTAENLYQAEKNVHIAQTLTLLDAFSERYLELESSESDKMFLELSANWDCPNAVL